jgi:predicted ATPase
MEELMEEFRDYSNRGGQVFISTHSPDLLNHAELADVFWLVKKDGFTSILRAKDNEMISAMFAEGNQLGFLWKQDFFNGSHPK